MILFLKIYLPIYLIAYLVTVFVWPTYRTWKANGVNPITFRRSGSAHDIAGAIMKILMLFIFISVFIFSLSDRLYEWLRPIDFFSQRQAFKVMGLIAIHASIVWIWIAQYQMKHNWRIGIDRSAETELVTHGLFSISRNPVFLGIIVSTFGIFLLTPNIITMSIAVLTYVVLRFQIAMEEQFLKHQLGKRYLLYMAKTRRFI